MWPYDNSFKLLGLFWDLRFRVVGFKVFWKVYGLGHHHRGLT